MDRSKRAWVAECRWSGRERFWVGTFFLDAHETEETARLKAQDLAVEMFEKILPVEVQPPDWIVPIPGIVWFEPEEKENEKSN